MKSTPEFNMSYSSNYIVYFPRNAEESEMAQRIAFSFGYRWELKENCTEPYSTEMPVLYFYPLMKVIRWGEITAQPHGIVQVKYLSELLDLLKQPSVEVEGFTLYSNGTVVINQTGLHIPAATMDKIIHERRKIYMPR